MKQVDIYIGLNNRKGYSQETEVPRYVDPVNGCFFPRPDVAFLSIFIVIVKCSLSLSRGGLKKELPKST